MCSAVGVQHLVWSTDNESDLERIIIPHPSPRELPRTAIADRLRN